MITRGNLGLCLVLGVAVFGVAEARSQASPPSTPGVTAAASVTAPAVQKKKSATRKRRTATQVIPLETAPVSAPATSAAQDAQQRAVDQQVLQQQQAQSAAAAKATDQQVQRAQQRVDQQQREVRIQDVPGPAQTGVPGPAGMTQPPTTNDRIQDAPGPAQTLPQVPSTQPTVPTTPSSPIPPTTVPPQI